MEYKDIKEIINKIQYEINDITLLYLDNENYVYYDIRFLDIFKFNKYCEKQKYIVFKSFDYYCIKDKVYIIIHDLF